MVHQWYMVNDQMVHKIIDDLKILILNGPNLNLIGKRKPEVYGWTTMESEMIAIQRRWVDVQFTYQQSNHEGDLIDWIQRGTEFDGIVLNAGGYTHTSVAIRDAVEYVMEQGVPVVEVHISDIRTREPFRQHSLLTDVCALTIIGEGIAGYEKAVDYLISLPR